MQLNNKNWRMIRLIIFVLAMATLIVIMISALHNKAKKEPAQKLEEIPEMIVETMPKCLLLSGDENGVSVLWNGEQKNLIYDEAFEMTEPVLANRVADITLTNDRVTAVVTYNRKINAKLIEIKENNDSTWQIELAGYGSLMGTSDLQVYKLFGSVESYTLSDLIIGYAFTDFVLDEQGQIVAALAMQQEEMEQIRVLIKTDNFEASLHEKIELSCDGNMTVATQQELPDLGQTGNEQPVSGNEIPQKTILRQLAGGEILEVTADSELFQASNRIFLIPEALSGKISLLSLTRNQGVPGYYGVIEIEKTQDGLAIVNELPLEEYLYSVVPSEMPASYPIEALKAQAICARTYAYVHMLHAGLQGYGAHVDDSADFQVYNNIAENGNTTIAVRDTEGKIMYNGESALTAYFYSTSCGYGTNLSAWNLSYDDPQAATDGYLIAGAIAPDTAWQTQTTAAGASTFEAEAEGSSNAMDLTQEEVFDAYIKSVDESSYEKDDSYYRWRYETQMNEQLLLENIQKRFERDSDDILTRIVDANGIESYVSEPVTRLGDILSLKIQKRSAGGIATELMIEGSENTILVRSEQNIRYILAGESTSIKLGRAYSKDGTVNGMLPSSFLMLQVQMETKENQLEDTPKQAITNANEESSDAEKEKDEEQDTDEEPETESVVEAYTVYGGGFGHGIGMSQNGARAMAAAGKSCDEILHMFYQFEYKE